MLAHVFRLVPLLRPLVSNGHGNGNDEAGGKETAEAKATATARVKPGGAIRLVTAGARRSFDCARGARCAQDDGGWVVRTAGTRFDAVFVSGIWARSGPGVNPFAGYLGPAGLLVVRISPQTCQGRFPGLAAAPARGHKYPARSFRAGLIDPIPITNTTSNSVSNPPHPHPIPAPPVSGAAVRTTHGAADNPEAAPG